MAPSAGSTRFKDLLGSELKKQKSERGIPIESLRVALPVNFAGWQRAPEVTVSNSRVEKLVNEILRRETEFDRQYEMAKH